MVEKSYIYFQLITPAEGRKTLIWEVVSKSHGDSLGRIRWEAAWRQYAFFPATGTLFNVGCLTEISAFLDRATTDHRKQLEAQRVEA